MKDAHHKRYGYRWDNFRHKQYNIERTHLRREAEQEILEADVHDADWGELRSPQTNRSETMT